MVHYILGLACVTQRNTFKRVVILMLSLLIQADLSTAQSASPHFNIQELVPGIYAAMSNNDGGYAICNAGIVDLGDRTLIFDPFMHPQAARDLRQSAIELTGRAPSLVVNSHFHNDHVRGNQVFADEAEIIGTSDTRVIMDTIFAGEVEWEKKVIDQRIETYEKKYSEATEEEEAELRFWLGYYHCIKSSHQDLRNVLPTMTSNEDMTIHGKRHTVVLKVMKGGHSPGDMVLWIPGHRILFGGDLVFKDHHPWLGDGDPEFLLDDLDSMIAWSPEIVVPGHGPVSNVSSIQALKQYTEDLIAMVRQAKAEEKSEDEIAVMAIPESYRHWWYSRFLEWNLRFLYRTLPSR